MKNLSMTEGARAFNSSLKKLVQEATGQKKVKVEIINSYKFPHCWVRVYAETVFSNEFRLRVLDGCGHDRKGVDLNDVSYGNIRSNYISAYAKDWCNIFNAKQTFEERINDASKTPLAEGFILKIKTIAELSKQSEDYVWEKWCAYSDYCRSADQSAVLFEFCQWNKFPIVE